MTVHLSTLLTPDLAGICPGFFCKQKGLPQNIIKHPPCPFMLAHMEVFHTLLSVRLRTLLEQGLSVGHTLPAVEYHIYSHMAL